MKSEELEKKLVKERQRLEEEMRQNDMAMNLMRNEIDKHADVLVLLREYKDFMIELTPAELRKPLLERQREERESLKQDWVEKVKTNEFMDFIIFDEGEILGDDAKRIANALAIPAADAVKNRHLESFRALA